MRAIIPALLLMVPGMAAAQTTVRQEATPVVSVGSGTGAQLLIGPGTVVSLTAVNGTTAGFAVLYGAATIPADGALDPTLVRWCMPLAANTGITMQFTSPLQFYAGMAFFVSSGSCTNKTAVTYGYVGAQVRQ